MTHLRPLPTLTATRTGRPGCADRCARLCTDSGLAQVLGADKALLHWRALRRLGDPGLAEHAVQETLLRAWRACGTYNPDRGSVRTWLLTIERNVLTDIARVRAARPGDSAWDELGDVAEGHYARPDFADTLADGLLVAELLSRLPAPQRDAVVQVILNDRAYQDVAADMGVPVGTVKTRVHYALRSLRRLPLSA
ncbi:sigma-70 family RNA polymerase sigma factor [Nocardia otitidiscaviarum]|uniref:Sigma-70 family RNA polymerase sigma factor n=1 Tax=Nocardia otitidiscaviarum TaxID=1823 RepID=A0A516NHI2_9NOCA|nr:sigma-70 family RNA polymerase sigma factor [Nocardia otitidiscaviarum]MBF6177572.1 sigma-70 family RNA polymerase sigma factor [Nocardia otitidiscaviarum]MCP9620157.1 sigma-70 family RNA polymerase sigma factor [Nocardia otitidiscaviarum]QDP78346.1 sigma-70 family RNA polymerase sigma factor [Nocardia otitidiscaviarum]